MSRLRSSFAESFDLVDDGIRSRRPDKRFRLRVVMRQVPFNRGFQRAHVVERPATNALRRDVREEALDLIEPARARRRDMHVIPRMTRKPARDLGNFMRPIVIHDDVHLARWRQAGIDLIQELEELLVPMPAIAAADHLPGRHIQRREQRGGDRPTV